MEGGIPRGAVTGGVVGKFCARQKFVPRGFVVLDQTAQEVAQRSVGNLCMAISLRVERGRKSEHCSHEVPEGFPERTGKPDVVIRNDASWEAVQTNDLVEEEPRGVGGIGCLGTGDEVSHLAEPTDDDQDSVQLSPRPG